MSFHEGSNWQARKEDEGKPLYDTGKLEVKKTQRGFEIAEFKDRNGAKCSIQESSIATESCIWLGTETDRMHLTVEQVKSLLPLLNAFVSNETLTEAAPPAAGEKMRDALEKILDNWKDEISVKTLFEAKAKDLNNEQAAAMWRHKREGIEMAVRDLMKALSQPPGNDEWVREKPAYRDCILLTASWDERQKQWDLEAFTILHCPGEGESGPGWYWALCEMDGEEWGDINDLQADLYKVIELPTIKH